LYAHAVAWADKINAGKINGVFRISDTADEVLALAIVNCLMRDDDVRQDGAQRYVATQQVGEPGGTPG